MVYNAPEILTNSSNIFLGIPLYCLLAAFRKLALDSELTHALTRKCQQLLKKEYSLEAIDEKLESYFQSLSIDPIL